MVIENMNANASQSGGGVPGGTTPGSHLQPNYSALI